MKKVIVGGSAYATGALLKWAEQPIGFTLDGIVLGFRPGSFGPLCDLETPQGPLTVPCPTTLERDLRRVRTGAAVCIEYRGKVTNPKTGRTFHSFVVGVDKEEDLLPQGIEAELATLRVEAPPAGTKGRPAW